MFDILNVPELGNLEIVEIYDYYNMPILFSCQNSAAQLYMVFFADYFPEYEMWLYAEVSPMRFKRIRSGEINLYDTFREPEMERLLKAMFSHETPAEFIDSQYIHPNQLDNDVFPPVSKCLNIQKDEIPELVDALKVIEEEQEKSFEVEGRLIGLSLTTKKFEIETETNDKPIKGYIQKDANSNIRNATISRQYKATMKEVIKRNEMTDEVVKTEHILLNLEGV
ncbi:MAG: hypothetical protein OXI43_05265 [Candidatus Poribacteria bacterium]|nr:hypothetical protein [Candidatus Poribacteria bacterium]